MNINPSALAKAKGMTSQAADSIAAVLTTYGQLAKATPDMIFTVVDGISMDQAQAAKAFAELQLMLAPPPPPAVPLKVDDDSDEKSKARRKLSDDDIAEMNERELLKHYDHNRPGRIGAQLNQRANGKPFLLFNKDKSLNEEQTVKQLEGIIRNRPVDDRPLVDGRPTRPLRVGDPLNEQPLMENPLLPSEALLEPNQTCRLTRESWDGVSRRIRVLLHTAVSGNELRHMGNAETMRSIIKEARALGEGGWDEFSRRYPNSAEHLDKLGESRWPTLELATSEAQTTSPFAVRASATERTALYPLTSTPTGTVRIAILCGSEDEKGADSLRKHMMPLTRSQVASLWHPGLANPEFDKNFAMEMEANAAQIVLVFVSPDLPWEMWEIAITQSNQGKKVIPINYREAERHDSFKGFVGLPRKSRAIVGSSNQDQLWTEVVKEIRAKVEQQIQQK